MKIYYDKKNKQATLEFNEEEKQNLSTIGKIVLPQESFKTMMNNFVTIFGLFHQELDEKVLKQTDNINSEIKSK